MESKLGQSSELISQGQQIRHQVFVVEQGISAEDDLDGLDQTSIHVVLYDCAKPIATARLTPKTENIAVMSRIAVLPSYRGLKLATPLIQMLVDYAQTHNFHVIKINAHYYLQPYYEKFGFVYHGEAGKVAQHRLVEMHLHCQIKAGI